MGFVVVGGGEERLVGRDQRQPFVVSEINQRALGAALDVEAVALQFDIEPVAEQLRQPLATQLSQRLLVFGHRE
jgi:hypothetical protein